MPKERRKGEAKIEIERYLLTYYVNNHFLSFPSCFIISERKTRSFPKLRKLFLFIFMVSHLTQLHIYNSSVGLNFFQPRHLPLIPSAYFLIF